MQYDQKELQMGIRNEMQHTKDTRLAEKLAMDHLRSDPHYYSKLNKAGLEEGDVEEYEDIAIVQVDARRSQPSQSTLKSSDLGSGTPKPLQSDNLGAQAPNGDNMLPGLGKTPPKIVAPNGSDAARPNKGEYGKTPNLPGTNCNSDATDYVRDQISKALSTEIPRVREFIPANVSESKRRRK
jgi:hypothetical protein